MNIILVGFKGAGKTTVGRRLSSALKMDFIDTDELISSGDARARSPRAIFREDGPSRFRALEEKAIASLKGRDNLVISAGGGAADSQNNRKLFKKLGTVIYLDEKPDVLYMRMLRSGMPPFIGRSSPRKSFDELYETRQRHYEEIAGHKVSCAGLTENEVVGEIKKILKRW